MLVLEQAAFESSYNVYNLFNTTGYFTLYCTLLTSEPLDVICIFYKYDFVPVFNSGNQVIVISSFCPIPLPWWSVSKYLLISFLERIVWNSGFNEAVIWWKQYVENLAFAYSETRGIFSPGCLKSSAISKSLKLFPLVKVAHLLSMGCFELPLSRKNSWFLLHIQHSGSLLCITKTEW